MADPDGGGTLDVLLDVMAEEFSILTRSPILHTPAESGLEFEDVTFPSEDGTPLEGWLIPANSADTIIIMGHPQWCSRAGLPSHLEPWKSLGAYGGNDFEVNFIPDMKILHDAGYTVLAYDHRNFGHSGAANNGFTSNGIFESRDVVGAVQYVRGRQDTGSMRMGLFSRSMDCNATFFAVARRPDVFEAVRCLVGCQPLSVRVAVEQRLLSMGIPLDRLPDLDERIRRHISFRLEDLSPLPAARKVTLPTLLYQVRDDVMTRPSDVQSMFDSLPAVDKALFWIEGTTRRWDGYCHFQKEPARVLDWFERHLT
ncbi:alpha/beta hydrolase [Kribbella sp. NPDC004536]|uniref:alpha/beta hydrolase n=1 Tax=Kribbella sp. NPDC004536 TaxID=3364106 RepID=UPI003699E7FA